eukprot:GHVS01076183.1.p1 GENE.GHVS01076183.1~~GHVS01076183.1.p1  ORF type:complete len:344 (-),score=44.38 GHVS01076183.1:1894-2925(-)
MADAIEKGATTVVTCGGVQSNHCRATSVAARLCGLEPHVILRTERNTTMTTAADQYVGNLLVNQMMGASCWLVNEKEYKHFTSEGLISILEDKLQSDGHRVYRIPVGGSNAVGTRGYIDATEELHQQLSLLGGGHVAPEQNMYANSVKDLLMTSEVVAPAPQITDLVVPMGSGGTAGGLSLACWMCPQLRGQLQTHAVSVCDDAEYFWSYIDRHIYAEMNRSSPDAGAYPSSRSLLDIIEGKGEGYALSTDSELSFIQKVAFQTGVILDPVYTGKAAYHLARTLRDEPGRYRGRDILFLHTGGLLGLYDKIPQMAAMFAKQNNLVDNKAGGPIIRRGSFERLF